MQIVYIQFATATDVQTLQKYVVQSYKLRFISGPHYARSRQNIQAYVLNVIVCQ